MLLAQHGILGRPAQTLIPTDDTKTYSLQSTLDETRYYLNSLLHQNPKAKNTILNTFGDGVHHVSDAAKKISIRVSSDRGLTYAAKTTLYDPSDSTFQIQDPGIGFDRTGRLHIFADCHTDVGVAGETHEIRYMYSDDNGTTVSSPVVISFPATSLLTFRFYGRVIDNGSGVLIAPAYFQTEEGDTTDSERWILRSTDQGANWTWVLVEADTGEYINESEVLAVTPNIIFMVSRYETLKQFMMYKSTDAGLTWVRVGVLGTTITMGSAAPCRLHKFRADNGKWFVAMYFVDRTNERLYAVYGRMDNGVDGGLGLFNFTTLTLLRQDTEYLHYGDMCHYNNNMNCRGAWPREASTTPLVDNELIYFENLTTQYDLTFAALNPVTIYDKLGQLMFAATWRGLAVGTDSSSGIVNGSSQVTTWKSIFPGPLSQNFTATAGGITLGVDGIDFDGTKALGHSTSSYWNFMHFSGAGEADINYTIYFKAKFGTSSNPNAAYGLMGTGAATSFSRGYSLWYDDRVAVPRSDAIRFVISKNNAAFVLDFLNDNVITPNVMHVVCIEIDLSQSVNNDKAKLYVDGSLISTTVTTYNTGVAITPSFNMQIGATGNSVLPFIGTIKDVAIQNCIDLSSVRTNFMQALTDQL